MPAVEFHVHSRSASRGSFARNCKCTASYLLFFVYDLVVTTLPHSSMRPNLFSFNL